MSLFDVMSILIVDDDAQVTDLMVRVLTEGQPAGWPFRYNIKVANTLKRALSYVPGGGWDIIILDLGLPDSHGLATFDEVMKVAKAPIVVFTGTATFHEIEAIENAGAARVYSKDQLIGCMTILHYVIRNVWREQRKIARIELLQGALFEELRNLVTACSACNRWRNSASDRFMPPGDLLERYHIHLSHTVCPDCAKRLYPEFEPDNV